MELKGLNYHKETKHNHVGTHVWLRGNNFRRGIAKVGHSIPEPKIITPWTSENCCKKEQKKKKEMAQKRIIRAIFSASENDEKM